MPRNQSKQDRSLFPIKVLAALTSLVVMTGFLITSLTRGYNNLYTILIAATVLATAIAIGIVLRRRRRHR